MVHFTVLREENLLSSLNPSNLVSNIGCSKDIFVIRGSLCTSSSVDYSTIGL